MEIRGGKNGLSIKYKLLLLLVILPVTTLGLYLALAINLFESDKIAYVFDSSAAVAKTLAAEVHAEINSSYSAVKPILEGLSLDGDRFDQTAQNIFKKEAGLKWLTIYRPSNAGHFEKRAALSKTGYSDDGISVSSLAEKACQQEVVIVSGRNVDEANAGLLLAGVCRSVGTSKYAAVFLIDSAVTYEAFSKGGIYHNYLIEREGQGVLGPDRTKPESFHNWAFITFMTAKDLPEGTQETTDPHGNRVIASYSKVGLGNLYAISFIDRKVALQAVRVLIRKSLLFLFAIILCATIISVIASSSLTATLRELATATRAVAEGKFDINLSVRSSDEVGTLAGNFNAMASEVSRLMRENISKARMEKELETAKMVQETLLPPPDFQAKGVRISGSYEPASECGGDWWYYCEKNSKIFLWIGDVTGHGAPAAMITSAAKSAATIIETVLQTTTPAQALEILNKAVYHTSKGQIQMTFFVASFDQSTGEFLYANASHDVPFQIKKTNGKLTKQDFLPFNDVKNKRLGEAVDTKYDQASTIIGDGDLLLFYTDGVLDLSSPAGKTWGERNFLKSAMAAYSSDVTPLDFIAKIKKDADDFRVGTPLLDDVTFFACKYDVSV